LRSRTSEVVMRICVCNLVCQESPSVSKRPLVSNIHTLITHRELFLRLRRVTSSVRTCQMRASSTRDCRTSVNPRIS